MDGGNRRTIRSGDNIGWPNGLTIDFSTNKLYWMDAKRDHMMQTDFDGENAKIVLDSLSHPFGLDVHNGYAYWSDWQHMAIYRISLSEKTIDKKELLLSNVGGLMEIRVFRREHISSKKKDFIQDFCWVNMYIIS